MQMGLPKQQGVGVWAELLWHRTGTSCRPLWPSGFVYAASCVAEGLPVMWLIQIYFGMGIKKSIFVPYGPETMQ
jgi:hypothetical protein